MQDCRKEGRKAFLQFRNSAILQYDIPVARPVIALLTDFGTRDHYAGTMKGVALSICPDATLVERFSRTDNDTLRYEITVNDPSTWTAPWTAALNMKPQADGMFEYACHEGNHAMRNILSAARAAERNGSR